MTTDQRAEIRKLSHDIRNALHGVTINLEVARTRTERGIVDSAQLAPFLNNAASQLEVVTRLHQTLTDLAVKLVDAR